MPVHETDVCIIGAGISAALFAEKLSELAPALSMTIVEAGDRLFDAENRCLPAAQSRLRGKRVAPGLHQ